MKYSLNQLYFYLTEGCNLACKHCWIAPKFQTKDQVYPVLSFELFKSIIIQAKAMGLSGVKLTGGEPLMHPDIGKILTHIKDEELALTVETNGVLCTPELAKKIVECKNIFVSVSIDGAEAKTHEEIRGVSGSFDGAIAGVENLVKEGLKPQIIMSLMRANKDQMEPLVRMAETLGVESVKFNLVQPIKRGEKLHERGETLTIKELVDMGDWVERSLCASTDLRIVYDHPAAFRPLGKMFGDKGDGCYSCGILGILGVLANGKYALCGIGENVPELIFGDAKKDRLEDVWQKAEILNELRKGISHRFEGICKECLMTSHCNGSCIAQNYYRQKNLWAPFWYCDEANKAGLFPKSRKGVEK
jgi:SynChlorMet cassette radical SAM/SPASM protein ScmF